MRRAARRAAVALRFDLLESRDLLDAGLGAAGAPPDAAHGLMARFEADVSASSIGSLLGSVGGRIYRAYPDGEDWVALDGSDTPAQAAAQLRTQAAVVYAEPDSTVHVQMIPDDPGFGSQWGLYNPNGVDIDAEPAWDITTGNPSTIVAVIDSGIDTTHIDLGNRLWTDPVSGAHGWDFVDNNADITDDNGHGTHVAGILGATGDNGSGVAGVNWRAQIMPLKVIDASGGGDVDAAVSAIYYAVQHGARVINASWDGANYSQAMVDAINYAGSQGAVFVAAAGNESADNDDAPDYPADYRLPNVLSVAAADPSGQLAYFSNYGLGDVDVAAPGVNILSTIPGGYASYSGTSMATPFVSGVASLLIGLDPSLTAAQVVQRIRATTKPLPGLFGRVATGGMVDAYNALLPSVSGGVQPTSAPDATGGYLSTALVAVNPTDEVWTIHSALTGGTETVQFGAPGDLPVPAAYDVAGLDDFAVFRPSTAQWFLSGPNGARVVQFGAPGDIPVPADYDGDGKADLAVFRPSTATWYILGSAGRAWAQQFGAPDLDVPVPADYDGDGKVDPAVYRPATARWFLLRSSAGPLAAQFGAAGDVPVPADYDGDGRDDLAVYRPATAQWFVMQSRAGPEIVPFGFGGQWQIVMPADHDGQGKADFTIYRPSDGTYYMVGASFGPYSIQLGIPNQDIPTPVPVIYRFQFSPPPSALQAAAVPSGTVQVASAGGGPSATLSAIGLLDGSSASRPATIAPSWRRHEPPRTRPLVAATADLIAPRAWRRLPAAARRASLVVLRQDG